MLDERRCSGQQLRPFDGPQISIQLRLLDDLFHSTGLLVRGVFVFGQQHFDQ